jgi:ABC-type glycerol-3-phosphate transport system substrate-binding protein
MRAARPKARMIAGLAVGALLAAMGAASPAAAQYHGAIGYSPTTGAMGWSFDYSNGEDARQIALKRCAEHATDCKIAVQFADGCGVVVEGERIQTAAGSPSRGDAERIALRRCRVVSDRCVVRRWVCTSGSLF